MAATNIIRVSSNTPTRSQSLSINQNLWNNWSNITIIQQIISPKKQQTTNKAFDTYLTNTLFVYFGQYIMRAGIVTSDFCDTKSIIKATI